MALRIAYVTSGMGHTGTAICQALHRAGHRGGGCGPKSSRKDHWLKAQKALGYDFTASEGDATDWESTRAAFARVRGEIGEIDVLVNNAGAMLDMRLRQMGYAEWSAVLRSNLDTLFNTTKQVVDGMADRAGAASSTSVRWRPRRARSGRSTRHGQGRGHRFHALAGAGSRGARRDRQPGVARLHRRRHGQGLSAGAAGPHRGKRAGRLGTPQDLAGCAPGWPRTRRPS